MAWQQRGNHKYFYFWSKRPAGRQKVYMGRGPIAEIAAKEDSIRQAEKAALNGALKSLSKEVKTSNENLRELDVLVTQLITVEMIAAGYHRRGRGRWRKRQ